MRRRDFLKILLSAPVAAHLDVEKLLWVPGEKTIFIPEVIPVSLYGIPYHITDVSTGTWLGFSRIMTRVEATREFRIPLEWKVKIDG